MSVNELGDLGAADDSISFTGLGIWRYRTEITAPPASGQLRFDNADISLATEFYLHETNDQGSDVSTFMTLLMTSGSVVYIQDRTDADKFVLIELGTFVDNGAYRTFQISSILEGSGGEPSQNTEVTIIVSGTGAGGGDVSAIGSPEPADMTVAVWTGPTTIRGDDNFQWDTSVTSGRVEIKCVDNVVNAIGLLLIDPDSVLNPDGWQFTPGQAGLFDGTLILSHKPADVVANRDVTFLPGSRPTFGFGIAIAPDTQLSDENVGALAFFQPRDTTGREETKVSFVGFVGGTGHEGVFSIEGFNYGDTGLQFNRVAHFVVDADYRIHVDFLGPLLFIGTAAFAAGETGSNRNLIWGLELFGQGSTNDVTIYNDLKARIIEIPTGGTQVNFAGNIRPAGTVEWDKGADLIAAATLVLGSDGNSFDVTIPSPEVDITAISAKPIGTIIVLTFDGVLTFTHNATTLILQDDVDFLTEAGNSIGLLSYDGTNWQEIFRNDGSNVRASGDLTDQAMVRGNGGAKRIQTTGNLIGDDDEITMAGFVQPLTFTDTELNDIADAVNTVGSKIQGAMAYNSTQDVPVWAVGAADGSVWVDGAGTTVNTPV